MSPAPRGYRNGAAKVNEDLVREIRAKRRSGESLKALARMYGLHEHTVAVMCLGKTWSHVGGQLKPFELGNRCYLGSRNCRAKLTEDAVRQMRISHRLGRSIADLAREHGVSGVVAGFAIGGRTWKHVEFPGDVVASGEASTEGPALDRATEAP
jgi:hypothetical protein